jgi:hypothetical protein
MSFRFVNRSSTRGLLVLSVFLLAVAGRPQASDLTNLGHQPLGAGEAFRPVSAARLDAAAGQLRAALGPLDRLLARSASGSNWKTYLDWPALERQAAAG